MENFKDISEYCLNCINKPCEINGCPLQNHIPDFLHAKDEKESFEIITKTNLLPSITGRVCPFSKQCQGVCTRGYMGKPVDIGTFEYTIGDFAIENNFEILKEIDENLSNKKVAIIGSGPAGLMCAGFLAKKGIKVTIFEKEKRLGGLLVYGIPEFRLNKNIIKKSIQMILNLGIEYHTNTELGKEIQINDLLNNYDAIFLAIGANKPNMILDGKNVFSANLLLEEINRKEDLSDNAIYIPNFENKKVAIYGGGNVAIDTARTIKKYNANVSIIYRRDEKNMPAEIEEIEKAKSEGIDFIFQTSIIEKKDNSIKCKKTELISKQGETRPIPKDIENSDFTLENDYLILATGETTDWQLLNKLDLKVNKNKFIEVNENYKTSINKVFAGGDAIGTKSTIAWAGRDGREASEKIIEFLK